MQAQSHRVPSRLSLPEVQPLQIFSPAARGTTRSQRIRIRHDCRWRRCGYTYWRRRERYVCLQRRASDSTLASPDTITDFTHGSDHINTSAITTVTAVQGSISGVTQVAAHSIAWIVNGSNTDVLINTTAAAENQNAAQMEIVLTGNSLGLAVSDFTHAPAGVAGSAINLALFDPSQGQASAIDRDYHKCSVKLDSE